MKLRKRIAFTIIEVLTVLAILGTLIAIGVNEYTTSINTTRTITFRENVDAIVDCLNVHFSINHRYPDSLEEIRGCLNKTPINPFTGEDMLTDGSITYTPLNDGLEYIIVVHQPDVDDHDGDGDTDEPIIEPPTMLSENIHIIIHPSGAGTAQARPNPADSGVVVFLTSKAGQCYNFNSWQPISDITINNPLSPDTTFTMIGDEVSIMSKFDIKRYQVTLTSPGGEEVLGAGEYNCGEQVTVQAIPLTGHYFVGWYSGNTLVSTNPYYTFRIYSDVSLEARSAYYITLYANPTIGGAPTVSPNPAAYKTTVTLSANPDICYNFSGWTSPDITITGNTFIMPAKNVSITANYTIKQYQITVNITKTGNSPNTPGVVSGTGTYNCGSSATLTAIPATGFNFAGWYEGGTLKSTNLSYSLLVDRSYTLEARFNAIPYTITLVSNPTSAGSPSASPNPANVGQTVTLSANPGSCYNFSSWTVSAGTLSGNTLTMPAQNVTATANYTIKIYTIAVNITKTGNSPNTPGTVTGAGTYNCGSSATLVATPATGFSFAGWYEGTTQVSTNTTYSFTVNGARTLEARFNAIQYNITLVSNPTGAGSPSAAPNPAYVGQTVTLTANPGGCYNFNSWSAPAGVTISNNSFVMPAQNVSITANYTVKTYTIAVTITKTGNSPNTPGTVSGADTYNCGSNATLTAVPATGFSFAGWYEGTTQVSTNTTYSFTVNGARTLEARFNAIQYNITLVSNPTGAGSPSAAPNPAYVGQTVTLTANPGGCYNFNSWSAPAGVTISNNSFVMPAQNVSITANYTVKTYTIAVTITKTGNSPNTPGTVSGADTYNCGSNATLTAVPATGFSFAGWYEGTTQVSTNTTYSFTVNGARTLEARFNAIQYNITLVSNPTGAGSPSAAPNPAYVGQTVTLSAHTKICYTFNNWLVSAGTLNGDILTMPAQNVTVTANYTLQKYTITITVNNLSDSPNTPGTITGAGLYDCGTTATLTVVPSSGFYFIGWYIGTTQVSTNTTYYYTIYNNRTIEARFGAYDYKVTVVANPTGAGSPVATPQYAAVGETVTLTPNPSSNYNFSSWSAPAGITITNNSFVMPAQSVTITANYVPKSYTITLKSNPTGAGSPSASPNPANVGQTVTLSANPGSCYNFSSWTAPSGVTITNNSFVMPAQNVTATANYAIKTYTITTTITKTGNSPNTPGTVTGAGTYNCGSSATLVATPATGFNFAGWYEGTKRVSTNATYTFTVNGNRTLEARFSANTYTITLKANPTDGGTPSASPNPAYVGQTVTLSANPGSCYDFSSWSVSAGTLNGNTLTMPAQNVTATANYAIKTYTITLSVNNSDYGTVSGGGTYNCGSSRTISATPKTGYHFVNWSDGNTSSSRTFTLTENINLTANFAPNVTYYTITVNTSGCGSAGDSGSYASGSSAYLWASPCSGYHFDHWSDGSTSSTRWVTVTGNKTYTAYFAQDVVTYCLYPSAGQGAIISPSSTQCKPAGTTIRVTGSCQSGYTWSGFDVYGAYCGSGQTCDIMLNNDVNITAQCSYVPLYASVSCSVNLSGNQCQACVNGTCGNIGSSSSVQVECSSGSSCSYQIKAFPGSCYQYVSTTGEASGSGTCPINFGAKTVNFKKINPCYN